VPRPVPSHVGFSWLLVAGFALVGCGVDFLPWSAPHNTAPVAVRMTPSGQIEALLVPCSPTRIARFEVIGSSDGLLHENDPRVWQVDFSPPVPDLRSVVLGVVPPGAVVQTPWPAAGLADSDEDGYVVRAVLDNGERWDLSFLPDEDLADGEIRFHEQNISPETFAEQSRCP
jgi:hypothetical protein